jgi:hypothetical protein
MEDRVIEGERYVMTELEARHAYESWRGANTLGEELFIWHFLLAEGALPEWSLQRLQVVASRDQPRSIQSLWRRSQAQDELVQVEVVECPSRATAHRALLRAIWAFQSPLVRRFNAEPVGDVAFAFPGETAIVAARANLVMAIRSVSRALVPVTSVARGLDANIKSKLASAPSLGMTSQVAVRVTKPPAAHPGEFVPLEIDAAEEGESEVCLKFFAAGGEVAVHEGRIAYRAQREGPQQLTVCVVTPRGAVTERVEVAL